LSENGGKIRRNERGFEILAVVVLERDAQRRR